MDMLDRYLQAVRFFLPAHQQDDIIRELSENLRSRIEDREDELGRPLDDAELAAILREHGHPVVVAGRYRSRQQLIGPLFFPLYLFVLKAGLGVALLVTVVLAAVAGALNGDPAGEAVRAILAFPGRALMVFAWTTIGLAGLDIAQGHLGLGADWDPRTLPKATRQEYQTRLRALCELFAAMVGLIWLLLLPRSPFLILGPAAAIVEFAPVWRLVYGPMMLLTLMTAALHLADVARPGWTRPRSLIRLAINLAWLFLFALLARTDLLFMARPSSGTLPEGLQVDRVADMVNASFHIGFFVAAVVTVVEIGRGLYRLTHRPASTLSSV